MFNLKSFQLGYALALERAKIVVSEEEARFLVGEGLVHEASSKPLKARILRALDQLPLPSENPKRSL